MLISNLNLTPKRSGSIEETVNFFSRICNHVASDAGNA